MVLVSNQIGGLDRLQTLHFLACIPHVDINCLASIQDETVALVHGGYVQRHLLEYKGNMRERKAPLNNQVEQTYLPNADIAFAFHLKQLLLKVVRIDVLETAGDSAIQVTYTYTLAQDKTSVIGTRRKMTWQLDIDMRQKLYQVMYCTAYSILPPGKLDRKKEDSCS